MSTNVTLIASISITAEPNGRAVWLTKDGKTTIHGCRLSQKEAMLVARDLAASLGATSGLYHFNPDNGEGEES